MNGVSGFVVMIPAHIHSQLLGERLCCSKCAVSLVLEVVLSQGMSLTLWCWGWLSDGRDRSEDSASLQGGVLCAFIKHSNEWSWAITQSIHMLLAIVLAGIAVGIAAYACRGKVGICDSLRWDISDFSTVQQLLQDPVQECSWEELGSLNREMPTFAQYMLH